MIFYHWILFFFVLKIVLVQSQLLNDLTHLVNDRQIANPDRKESSLNNAVITSVTHTDAASHTLPSHLTTAESSKEASFLVTEVPVTTTQASSSTSSVSDTSTTALKPQQSSISSPTSSSPFPPPPPMTTATTSSAQTSSDSANYNTTPPNKPSTKETNRANSNLSPTTVTTHTDKDEKVTKSSSENTKETSKAASSETSSNHHDNTVATTSSSGLLPSSTSTKETNDSRDSSSNKTGPIVGAIVGSILGVALVGGLISCINRRGGCARRNNDKRSIEYEDFGLADTDFPPRQMPNMQSMTSDHVHTGQRFADATIPQLGPQGNHYHILPEEPHAQHQFEAKYLPPDEIGNEHQAYYYSHEQPVQHGAPTYYTNHNNYYSNY